MPIEVKAYQCEFQCGRRALISKSGMKEHEKVCFKNPVNRACQTCAHDKGHSYDSNVKLYVTHCEERGRVFSTDHCSIWSPKAQFGLRVA